jgi:molybdopterin-binding protein
MAEGLSARNQLHGTVKSLKQDTIVSEVVVEIAGQEVVAVITTSSVERLAIQVGDPITVIIKATEVMLEK